ncbi:MAG: ammonium transporter [Acidobacteriota bacterium]|nr:ammonium transporter [Acidobacteriota bacterium]
MTTQIELSSGSAALATGMLLLAPLALAGVALINTGLGRSRSAAQAMLGSLAIVSAAILAFALVGAMFAAPAMEAGHSFHFFGKDWNWAGKGPWLFSGFPALPLRTQLGILFEFLAVALAALIPWGSGADRLRIAAGTSIAALLAAFPFPILAYWIWGGGWLGTLGSQFGLGVGFIDPGGAGSIHVLGGFAALAVIWITGSRRGKFPREGLSTAMPGHNAIYVLFGCVIALIGWMGFNLAGALLWLDANPERLAVVVINTLMAAAAAFAASFAVTRLRFGKPDASLCANGWLSGLVASSACAAAVTPLQSLFAGLVAGIATPLLVEVLELALSIDDPSGALTAHLASGLWGLLVAGVFSHHQGQLIAQLVGIATILGLVFPAVYLLLALLNRTVPFRVEPDGERIGMDLHELGGAAYPEFVVHRDDSYR